MLMRKRLFALFTAVVLLCTMSVAAFAQEAPDMSHEGCSVRVTMSKGGKGVAGGSLTLYRVGAVYEDNGNYSFALTGNFTDCNVSLENPESAALAKKLADYAKNCNLTGTTKEIGKDGTVTFTDLELGLYLIVQNKAASGYNNVDSFLVTVPSIENGSYIYDVDASPKVELETAPEPPAVSPAPPASGLPQTGQLNWPIPVMVVLGLILFSIGWILRFGKEKGSYEK